jgi:hypothetical protein
MVKSTRMFANANNKTELIMNHNNNLFGLLSNFRRQQKVYISRQSTRINKSESFWREIQFQL